MEIADLDPKGRGVQWILTGVNPYDEAGTHTDEPARVRESIESPNAARRRVLHEMLDAISELSR